MSNTGTISPVLLIAVGGASCSGKSTFTNWLAEVFEARVIHQDQFYKADCDIPVTDGVANWDCIEAIDMPNFICALQKAKSETGFQSILGSNRPKMNSAEVSTVVYEELRSLANTTKGKCRLVFVDGFLLFTDPQVIAEFDAGFFLKASFNTLVERRNRREPYITIEGSWVDPPGYFEDLVWPAYLENNRMILNGTISTHCPQFVESLCLLDTNDSSIEANLTSSVQLVCRWIQKRVHIHQSKPPVAKIQPVATVLHNVSIIDNYAWLRWIDADPDVRQYLLKENIYAEKYLETLVPLQKTLIAELKDAPQQPAQRNRCLPQDENMTSFWEHQSYLYWITYADNKSHPIYKRRSISSSFDCTFQNNVTSETQYQPEEMVLDFNTILSKDTQYYYIGAFEVNPFMPNLVAYSIDLAGSERYTLRVRDIHKGVNLDIPAIENTYYSVRWAHDSTTDAASHWLYFNTVDQQYGTPMEIHRVCIWNCIDQFGLIIGTVPEIVYIESDISFTTELASSTDDSLIFVKVVGQETTELHLIISHLNTWKLKCIFPRQAGITYEADRYGEDLIIRTNSENSPNFRVIRIALLTFQGDRTETITVDTLLYHSTLRFIEKVEAFTSHMVVWFWEDGLRQLCITDLQTDPYACHQIQFHLHDQPSTQVYSLLPGTISDIEARLFRRHDASYFLFTQSSLLEPSTVFYIDFSKPMPTSIYRSSAPKIQQDRYVQLRLWISIPQPGQAPLRMPLSLFYRKDSNNIEPIQPRPTLLLAYGAYGSFHETGFSEDFFPLVDRGVLIAICHPRGDGDMGSQWYKDGKYEAKINTMSDTRKCIQELVKLGYSKPGAIALKARSAGGLIAGSAISWIWEDQTPMVNAIVAQVPFVDPIFDMLDESVPWTAFEWFEWGSPKNYTIFKAMMQYSPYLNIKSGNHPAVMVTAGMEDPRVPFWEPAKFVAKLRTYKTNEISIGSNYLTSEATPLLFRVYSTGHFSSMDEDARIKELTEWYSFLLCQIL
ncbi:ribosylnicotinamide kinase, variant 2 [Batrachochytrium dendrobatidis]